MAPIVFYHSPVSPFSRSVHLLIRYLKIDADIKIMDLQEKKEQFSPEFLKINPQHCVPTIDDNGFVLWESRAILSYLIESRAPEMVPTSPKEKAILNQRLHYELGGFTNKFSQLMAPLFVGSEEIDLAMLKEAHEILFTIDEHYFPNGNEWIAGENISAADFAYISTLSTIVGLGVSLERYPRLDAWMKRCKAVMPGYEEIDEKCIEMMKQFILAQNPNALKNFK